MSIKIYVKYVKNNRGFHTTKLNLPTGALDKKTGQQIMELLLQIVRENNIMLLLVTHDSDIANTCDTIFEMDEGRLRCAKNDF